MIYKKKILNYKGIEGIQGDSWIYQSYRVRGTQEPKMLSSCRPNHRLHGLGKIAVQAYLVIQTLLSSHCAPCQTHASKGWY